jgi:hypothetical protein
MQAKRQLEGGTVGLARCGTGWLGGVGLVGLAWWGWGQCWRLPVPVVLAAAVLLGALVAAMPNLARTHGGRWETVVNRCSDESAWVVRLVKGSPYSDHS